jgi:hypothetical protein
MISSQGSADFFKPARAGSFGNSSEVKVQSTTCLCARRSLTAPGRTDLMAITSMIDTVRLCPVR